MKLLEQKILNEGKVLPGDVLKVDCFLNHQMDVAFLTELGKEIYNHFKNCNVNKILTVESSGIGLACLTAQFFNCKVLVAKKNKSSNISNNVYVAKVYSYTHQKENNIVVSKEYLLSDDNVLIIDDFLANGNACLGLIDIVNQAGGQVKGISCAVEKTYQGGYDKLASLGIDVYSLARIEKMQDGKITFVKD
ncbi:MAG: xanthine phosphoribosyltransferase [Clostridia bacterium]|nr:xanthine phosphoribosyltransferase [Clostridia bacterium]